MTPIDENLPPLDDQLLERLVDGELSEPERRKLLLQLESAPDGWRRCALAFLEDQCWREGLRSLEPPAPVPLPPPRDEPPSHTTVVGRRTRWGSLATMLAMSASFLLALGLGFLLRSAWLDQGRTAALPVQVATEEPTEPSLPEEPALAVPEAMPGGQPWQTVSVPVRQGEALQWPATER